MAKRRRTDRTTPLDAAQIAAVLALDVEREDALIRERAVELLHEATHDDPAARVPARDLELAALVDAFEGMPPPAAGQSRERVGARTNREIAVACRELVARIDASRDEGSAGESSGEGR